jgi:hypothetical protein
MSTVDPVHSPKPTMGTTEFVALAVFMMALFATSIDLMSPALDEIGADLSAGDGNTAVVGGESRANEARGARSIVERR